MNAKRTGKPGGSSPTAAEIARARGEMTQAEFGAMVYKGYRAVQVWESGERKMPPDTWKLIQITLKAWEMVKRGKIAPQALLDLGIELPKTPEPKANG